MLSMLKYGKGYIIMYMQRELSKRKHTYRLIEGIDICTHALVVKEIVNVIYIMIIIEYRIYKGRMNKCTSNVRGLGRG